MFEFAIEWRKNVKKVALHSLGCKVNSYETEAMEQMLKEAGYMIVEFGIEKADYYIINTCSVTNIADRKSRQMLHKAKKLNPDAVVIATGCYVQASSEEVNVDPSVDIVIGNNKKNDLLEIIKRYEENHSDNVSMIDIGKTNEYENLSIERVCEHTRAYIKVQDGCNQFCSYCIIPYTRGRVRSRQYDDIIDEVKKLVANGYKEVVITGIHVSSYGVDLENMNLLKLLTALNAVEGLERIRLSSLEPRIITDEFARGISQLEKLCPHFHLSLQSGCDETLKRMNRRYTADEYYETVVRLRQYFDKPAITTDVIVGFPGETDEEFEATKAFVSKVNFYEMHVFKYSRRKGTAADLMKNQVRDEIKSTRSNELITLGEKMKHEFEQAHLNQTMEVLFEEVTALNGRCFITGHTKTYIKVYVEVNDNADNLINTIDKVTIIDVKDGLVIGQLI